MSEVQELPQGWTNAILEEVCTIIMGQSPPSSVYNEKGIGIPFFQGKTDFTDLYPKVRVWCTESTKVAKKNDILLSVRAPVGPTNLAPSQCGIGRGLAAIRPYDNIDVRYILYAIRTFDQYLIEKSTGTTFSAVSGDTVRSFRLPLAPFPEQQRIVEALEQQLSRLDAGVVALRSTQQKLKRYRASVLKAAVEGKLTQEWRKSHPEVEPAPELLKRILQERRAKWEEGQIAKGRDPQKVRYEEPAEPDVKGLPELPGGWCWTTLEQITSAIRPICYGILMPKENVPDGVLYVKVKDMKGDKIDLLALHRTTPEIAAAYSRASLKPDDLLLAIRGTFGRVAEVPEELDGANITQDTARLDFSKQVHHLYSATYLRSPVSQKYFQEVSRGVAVKGVNIADVRLTPIMLPPFIEQEQIVSLVEERLSIISTLESTLGQVLKRVERMRQSILHRAFTGKLVPQDPNDEPASVLLERIRREREEATAPQKLKHLVYKANGKSSRKRVAESTQPYLLADVPDPEPVDAQATTQGGLWD